MSILGLHPGDAAFWCQGCTGRLLADTLLTYQRDGGGWPKNIVYVPGENYTGTETETYGSLDNGATVHEIRFLAQAWKETSVGAYRVSAQAGLDMVLDSQYNSGGWPQYWPLKPEGAYANAVTFNDNLHKNVMELLDEVVAHQSPFDVSPFLQETRGEPAVASGIQVLLDSQIMVVDPTGICPTRTNWCAQHDPVSLEPVAARSHEPVSFSGNEGMRLAQYLMTIESPSQEVKDAIVGAYVWAKKAILNGYYKALDEDGNKILIPKEGSQLWPRFATIPDSEVIFCDRGCVDNSSLMYHGWPSGYSQFEDPLTRNGYTWLGNWGATVISIFETQWMGQHEHELNPLCLNPNGCIDIENWSQFEMALSLAQSTVTLCAPFSIETDGGDARISSPREVICHKTDPSQECEITGTSTHIYITSSDVTLSGFTFRGSQSSAVKTSSYLSNIKIQDCTFENNHHASSSGGAFRTSSGVSLEIIDTRFAYNSAHPSRGGGAVYTQYSNIIVRDSLFESNYAKDGGAIQMLGSGSSHVFLTAEGTTFSDNSCEGVGPAVQLRYGAFQNDGGNSASGSLRNGIPDCDGVYLSATPAECVPFMETTCTNIFTWSQFESALSSSQSTVTLCAPFSIETDGGDARISTPREVICHKTDPSQECEITGTSTHIYITSSDVTLNGFTFRGSQSTAVKTSSYLSNIKIQDCTFENNHHASSSGGAFRTSSGVSLEIIGTKFINNSAHPSRGGGAVYTQYSNIIVRDSLFDSNYAKDGGAIQMLGSGSSNVFLTAEGTTFSDNSCEGVGPAVQLRYGAVTDEGGNSASGSLRNGIPDCDGVYLSATPAECVTFV